MSATAVLNTIPALIAKGYEAFPARGKMIPYKNWAQLDYEQLKPSLKRSRATQIGLRCNNGLLGIDLDCEDLLEELVALMVDELGPNAYERIGRPGRALYPYYCPEVDPVLGYHTGKFGGNQVELIGRRQQFIVAGQHPDTKQPYRCPELPPLTELPQVSKAQLHRFMHRAHMLLEGSGLEPEGGPGGGGYEVVADLTDLEVVVQTRDAGPMELGAIEHGARVCMSFLREGADNPDAGVVYTEPFLRVVDHVAKVVHTEPARDGGAEFREALADTRGPFRRVMPVVMLPLHTFTDRGALKAVQPAHQDNVAAILEFAGIQVRYNQLLHRVEYHVDAGQWDADALYAWAVHAKDVTRVNPSDLLAVAPTLAEPYHPVAERMPAWDGRDRLQELFETLPCADAQVRDDVLRAWLLQAVDAVFGGNAMRAQVLTLVGAQGIGKTRWVMALAGGFGAEDVHLDMNGNSAAKDSVASACRAWIAELGELDATFRRSDIARLKGFLSATEDSYRPAYARAMKTFPRRTVFAATVNDPQFLVDATGNRRFWPLHINGPIRIPQDVWQVWAQVHELWKAGERHHGYRMPQEYTEQFEQTTDLSEAVEALLERCTGSEAEPLNVSDVVQLATGGQYRASMAERAKVRAMLCARFGPPGRLRCGGGARKKGAWWVPKRG